MNDYQQLALNTLSDKYHIGVIKPDLMHAAIGMATECGELLTALHEAEATGLDEVNIREEFGDVMWYVAVGCEAEGITIMELLQLLCGGNNAAPYNYTLPQIVERATALSCELLDIIKRAVFYGSPLDHAGIKAKMARLVQLVGMGCHAVNASLDEVCDLNIAKLQRRFPNRFTSTDAVQRDLVSEREALGGGVA